MKFLFFLTLILFSVQSNAQKFNRVVTTSIGSLSKYTNEYSVKIEFNLDEEDKSLIINKKGAEPILIRFDVAHSKRNGIYLLTIGKPDYFIISSKYVIHHREYQTELGLVVVRNRYSNKSTKM